MSGAEAVGTQRYGTIVIVGGGCYGGYYVRQLQRAANAGAVTAQEILVVDRDAACGVALSLRTQPEPVVIPTRVVVQEWRAYFTDYLGRAASNPVLFSGDAIVPSPLMPHLMGDWLVQRARSRWGENAVNIEPFERPPSVPWDRAGSDGTHYVSFATWTCPINCIEPRICPHTKGERSWSLPDRLAEYSRNEKLTGHDVEVAVLHCRHRAYGVGMFDTAEVLAADALIASAADDRRAEVVIGTVSHCHGALTRLVIAPRTKQSDSQVD